ncbi:MAG: hypothetical protein ABIN25_11535 [Ginsengibacter sp.]
MKNYQVIKINERIKNKEELRININSAMEEIDSLLNSLKAEVGKEEADFFLKEICYELIFRLPLPVNYFEDTFILRGRPNYNGEIFKNAKLGILYSSSMTDNTGLNIVLSKDIIDTQFLDLDAVMMYKGVRDPANSKKINFPKCSSLAKVDAHGNFSLRHIL